MGLAYRLQPWTCLLIVAFFLVSNIYKCASAEPQVPCYFIFGDSLSDDGNNNDLATTAKVDYSPYGIDFPKGPTGRFTNGRTMQDIIGLFSLSPLTLSLYIGTKTILALHSYLIFHLASHI